jgi:fumarate hydratase subunit beta
MANKSNLLKVNLDELIENIGDFQAGTRILLSGIFYTARDAAHERIIKLLDEKKDLPFPLENSCIYYCGPAPAKPNEKIGACGPTTSARMDAFTPRFIEEGAKVFIGKGKRSKPVVDAIARGQAIYLVGTGGIAALLSKTIIDAQIIAFADLGPEAVYKLNVCDMPLIVGVDSSGRDIFRR